MLRLLRKVNNYLLMEGKMMSNIENLIPPIGTTKLEINTKHLESDEMFLSVLKHIYTTLYFLLFFEKEVF